MRVRLLLSVLATGLLAPNALAQGPAATTGNVLVLLKRNAAGTAASTRVVQAVAASAGGRPAGRSVPEIGLITLRPPRGLGVAAFERQLRRLPGVASVQTERRYVPRSIPNDPALTAADSNSGVVQWALAREGFYTAWNYTHGNGALVGVVDTGIDGGHPELRSRIAVAVDQQDPSGSTGPARTDQAGHGTHVASLACAATNNGIGMAGAGYDCRLVIEKSDFSDSSIAAAIVDAANRHVQALNMSFGPVVPNGPPAPQSEVRALQYAAARKVVLVAAAADSPVAEQGDPGNVLQPHGTGSDIGKGLGLDVTAAAYNGARASFAGYGSEISLAAYGALDPNAGGLLGSGPPPGIFGAFPGNQTQLEQGLGACGCRTAFGGDSRYAYLQGTSMAAPQVAATAAMMRALNPYASLADVLRILKLTAQRPAGSGWSSNLGWGVLNAAGAINAIRTLDRLPPVSRLFAPRVAHHRSFVLSWSGHDQRRPGLVASGIARYQVYVRSPGARSRLVADTAGHTLRFHGLPGVRYVFSVIAVDRAGNREHHAVRASTRVARRAR